MTTLRLEFARTTLARGLDHAAIVERVILASRAMGTDVRLEAGRLILSLSDADDSLDSAGRP